MPMRISPDYRELVALQHGVIARRQAVGAGVPAKAVEGQVRYGRWTRLQRGIYAAFTGDPSRGAQLWGALLRAGPGATFSHETAAELAGLTDRPSPSIHITVPASRQPGRSREIPGVVIHRSRHIDRARHPTLLPPQTRVEETVLDLTQKAPTFEHAFTWLCRAVGQRLTTPERMRQAARARGRLRWRTEISAALDEVGEGARSILEFRYVSSVERPHGLPPGHRQARPKRPSGNTHLDDLYEDYLVRVELDGRASHPAEERWRDIRRDNAGAEEGIVTLRFGWSDVTERPCETAGQVAAVLRRRGWEGAVRPCGPSCVAAQPRAPS